MQPPVVPTIPDLVIIPFILYFIGMVIYVAQVLIGRQAGSLPKRRWSGAIFVVIGCIVAWPNAWLAMNPETGSIYRMMLTRKVQIVQIGTPFVGLALLAGMFGIDLLTKRYIRSHYMG